MKPITGISPYCAPAVSGQTTAAPHRKIRSAVVADKNTSPIPKLHRKCSVELVFFAEGVRKAAFGGDRVFRSGAPRPMKMGTIRSPFHYDIRAYITLDSPKLRRSKMLYVSC